MDHGDEAAQSAADVNPFANFRGLDQIVAPWATPAFAEAARDASSAAALGMYDSRTSEQFLMQHMNQWSRDTGSDASFPPPPPVTSATLEDFREKLARIGSGNALPQHFEEDSWHHQGTHRFSIPEEDATRPGQTEQASAVRHPFPRAEPVRRGFEHRSSQYRTSEPGPNLAHTTPWLTGPHGRMELPPPPVPERGIAQDAQPTSLDLTAAALPRFASPRPPLWEPPRSARSTPRAARGASPRPQPPDDFPRWRATINPCHGPLNPPPADEWLEDRDISSQQSSVHNSWVPWRRPAAAHSPEEAVPFHQDDLSARQMEEQLWRTTPRDPPANAQPWTSSPREPPTDTRPFMTSSPMESPRYSPESQIDATPWRPSPRRTSPRRQVEPSPIRQVSPAASSGDTRPWRMSSGPSPGSTPREPPADMSMPEIRSVAHENEADKFPEVGVEEDDVVLPLASDAYVTARSASFVTTFSPNSNFSHLTPPVVVSARSTPTPQSSFKSALRSSLDGDTPSITQRVSFSPACTESPDLASNESGWSPKESGYSLQSLAKKQQQQPTGSGMRGSATSLQTTKSVASAMSMMTRRLDPEWKKILKNATSFKVSQLQEVVGGVVTSNDGSEMRDTSTSEACVRACCTCCGAVNWPIMIPCCTLFLSLVFVVGLAVLLWVADLPDVAEGAFGFITQTDRGDCRRYSNFEKAREHSIASLSADLDEGSTPSTVDLEDQGNASAEYRIDYVTNTLAWRHVELIYTRTGGKLTEKVDEIKLIEASLKNLPGWKKLCEKVPLEQRRFCDVGDSFAAVVFGTDNRPKREEWEMGARSHVSFNGLGSGPMMPMETFLQYLKDFQEAFLKRWFAVTGPQIHDSPIRSLFSFYLSIEDFAEWDTFVKEELAPLLVETSELNDGSNGDGTAEDGSPNPVRIIYRADGLVSREFVRAVAQDANLRAVPPLAVGVSVMLTSRRIILSLAATILSVTAPLISSTLAAGKGPSDRLEYPAVTVASWFIVAVSCAELALATAIAWSSKDTPPMLPGGLRKVPGWGPLYRFLRFMFEVPAPTMGPALSLFITGFCVDLPLVSEFTLHTSLGLTSACFFGVVLYPSACELGDRLAENAQDSLFMKDLREITRGLLPVEFGGHTKLVSKMDELAVHLVEALSSKTVRTFAFLVLLAVFVGAIGFKETKPVFTSETPELFHNGHRLRIAGKVRELFGSSELLADTGAPPETLDFARKCTPDCYDKLECSWYKCEVNEQEPVPEGQCSCWKQTDGPDAGIRSCGAVARFAAIPPGMNAFAKVTFWRWAEEELGVFIVNNSVSSLKMGTLEMESWATGGVITEKQMVVKTHGADGQAPLWEDACLRVLCYCGTKQCALEESWTKFGQPKITAPDRRVSEYPSISKDDSMTDTAESARALSSAFGIHDDLVKDLDQDGSHVEVYVIWGLLRSSSIPRKVVRTNFAFGHFVVQSPWVQRNLYGFCAGISPELNIKRSRCWIVDFKRWLDSRGHRFPVPSEDFYHRFHSFLANSAHLRGETYVTDGAGNQRATRDKYDYFWLSVTGQIQGCYMAFTGIEQAGLQAYKDKWAEYMFRRSLMDSIDVGFTWHASPQFAAYEAEKAVKDAAKNTVALSFTFLAIASLTLTWSPGLAMAIVLIEAVTLGILVGIGVGLGRREFGAMEVCGLAIFMSGLITPLIRVAHQYTLARDGPGDPPDLHGKDPSKSLDMREFRPRSASVYGADSIQLSDVSSIEARQVDGQEETYLVDNGLLRARTKGLAYRMTPNHTDVDKKSVGILGLAQWGTTVVGKVFNTDFIQVGERFLPFEINDCTVLILQEREKPPERLFSPETSEASSDVGSCMEELKACLVGPYQVVKIWRGATSSERKRRVLTAVKRSSSSVLGVSLAGFLAGIALVQMRMEGLGRIGLAALCAAVTAPTAALGLLPMLAMVQCVGPSRVRRRAFAEFIEWLHQGMPRGSQRPEDIQDDVHASGFSNRGEDRRTIGEVAAEALGLPFSLTVKTFAEHIPDSLQWLVNYRGRRYYDEAH